MNAPEIQSDEQFLSQYLHERDVLCPLCKYNLRGLTTPRCPERGRELRLSVGLTEPFLRAWITMVVALSAAAGFGVLFWIVLVFEGFPLSRARVWIPLIYLLASPILLFAAIAGRRPFIRLKQATQWLIAFGALFAAVAAVVALAAA